MPSVHGGVEMCCRSSIIVEEDRSLSTFAVSTARNVLLLRAWRSLDDRVNRDMQDDSVLYSIVWWDSYLDEYTGHVQIY